MASLLSLEDSDISLRNETINNDFKKMRGKVNNYDQFCSFKSLTIVQKNFLGSFRGRFEVT